MKMREWGLQRKNRESEKWPEPKMQKSFKGVAEKEKAVQVTDNYNRKELKDSGARKPNRGEL